MKRIRRRSREDGYTLMELLVTVALFVLISGMAVAAMTGILRTVKRNETRTLLTRIDQGLNAFHDDHGYFPLHPDPPIPGAGRYDDDIARQAVPLYQALSGDFDMDGKVDPIARAYVDGLDVGGVKGGYLILDPFGSPVRYLAAAPGVSSEQRRTRNSRFDLWSLGGEDSPGDAHSWIVP